MPTLSIHLFGAPRIERDGMTVAVERRKSLALLAYLAVTRQPHGRDALATLLWPDFDAERARAALRRILVDLNATLGKGWIEAEGDRIAFRAEPGLQVDVERFHAVLAQVAAHSHPPHRLCDACLANLAEAAGFYTGDFLAGFTLEDAVGFDDWQTFQSESLRLELAAALERLAQGLAGRQQWEAATNHARRWLALDPLNESGHRFLMQLRAWAGDRAAAVRQYQECVNVLQEELGIEPEPDTTALFEAVRSGAAGLPSAPLLPGSPAPVHNLPPDPTPFIGRERELAQVAVRLADPACRLLTILGPGGMGKTRLAIQVARAQTDVFAHGVWFVDLAPLPAADLLPAVILQALGVTAAADDATAQLTRHLRDKHLLLVLDNFEHLTEEGTALLQKLLAGAPKVKLLVTSRARLNVRDEWLAPLEGLEVSGELDRDGAKEHEEREVTRSRTHESSRSVDFVPLRDFAFQRGGLERYSATALFLACARRLRPNFQPTADEAQHIVHLCRLLDGMPLAIELAAAHTRALPLEKLARDLEKGLQLLSTSMRDVPQRHRSMAAAFDHSWQWLTPRQQGVLCRFSVFRGGCTAEAAEAVVDASTNDLEELVDASWVRLDEKGRYGLHELTRQYCEEKLKIEHAGHTGETPDQVRGRHAAYYRSFLLARQHEFELRPEAFAEVATEQENLLAAWNWLVAADNLSETRTMISGLGYIAFVQGWGRVLMQFLEIYRLKLKHEEIARDDLPGHISEGRLVQGRILATLLNGHELVSRDVWDVWSKESVSLLAQGETDDDRWWEVRWLLRYGIAQGHQARGNYAEAADLVRTLLVELDAGCFRPWPYIDDARSRWQIDGSWHLGWCALYLGKYEEAQRVAEQGIALANQIGAESLRWYSVALRAETLIYANDCKEAEKSARELLRAFRSINSSAGAAMAFWIAGMALAGMGSYSRARAYLRRALAFARESGKVLVAALHHLSNVELALGNLGEARRNYRELIALSKETSSLFGVVVGLTGLARVALVTGDLAAARQYLLRALPLELHARPIQHTIEAIATMTELMQAEGQLETAAELCAALLIWPETPRYAPDLVQHLRTDLEARLRALEAQLPPETFAAVTARGRQRQIDEVVAQLIGEPVSQPADVAAALI